MKIYLVTLLILTIAFSCKKEEKSSVNTDKDSSEVVINEKGDTIAVDESGDSLGLAENGVILTDKAIQQNSDGTYSFKYNLEKGGIYPFVLKTNQTQTYSQNGQSMTIKGDKDVEFEYEVIDIVNNNFVLKAVFKGFYESSTGPDGVTISYNTKNSRPSDSDVAQSWVIYKAIVGQSFTMEINNQGRVVKINGLDKVRTNVRNELKEEFSKEEHEFVKEMLEYSLGDEMIKMQFEDSLYIFPDKNIKVGEKWEDSQNISEGPLQGTSSVSRTFKEIENGVARIEVKGNQNVKGSETDPEQGIKADMSSNATLTGYIELDEKTGWLKKVSVTKKENMTNTLSMGEEKMTEKGSSTIVTTVN